MGTFSLETEPLHGIKRVPQCNHIGSTVYYRGESLRHNVLYTYINLHAGTPKPQSLLSVWEFRTTVVVVIWSYMVLEKLNKFTNISIQVRFIFVDIN